MNKKITSLALALMLTAGTSGICETNYKAMYPWAADAIDYCQKYNILKGDENGDLLLNENLTQAQCAALLVRTFNINYSSSSKFYPSNHWATNEIKKISGYIIRPDDFNADAPATREMFISVLMRSTGVLPEKKVSILKDNFKDYSSSYPEYLPYLAAAFKNGYVQGSENKLFPKDFLTRAEAITLIYRVKKSEDTQKVSETPQIQQTALLGPAQISVESAIKWAKSKGAHKRFIDVAKYYWLYGELTGIRPEVLYAQAAKETNYGKYGGRVLPEMNNWAGIKKYGATGDETDDHEAFATPEDGVRGHFNHMCAYVGVSPIGETHGRYKSVVSLSWAGTVKYVEELGGKWCPDLEYGISIVNMVAEMLKEQTYE